MLSITTGGVSHGRGCACKLKSAQVENWGPFFPPLILHAQEHPPSVWLYFGGTYIQKNKHILTPISLSFILMSLLPPLAQGSLWECSDAWAGRLRGLAEFIDIPPADLTVNQLIPRGAMGLDGRWSSFLSLLPSPLFLLHLSIYLMPPNPHKKPPFCLLLRLNISILSPFSSSTAFSSKIKA